ncbi:MAG: type II toxin-antitoxin system RelE/ParE family toxin [Ignavibacteria bacterium]|jgi:mRNA interferase RelE/StbE|nr:type II toxin-antitoxin system RelE/ParE family toxin [Ignavibacteria bacterium]
MYKIEVLSSADKALKNIPSLFRNKIVNRIADLSNNPFPNDSKKLKGSNFFRIRINDYRVIYQIEKQILLITVIKIDKRENVYN